MRNACRGECEGGCIEAPLALNNPPCFQNYLMMTDKQIAIIKMLLCAALWSIAGIFIKQIPWNPFVIAGARSAIAGITIFTYMRLTRRRIVINQKSVLSAVVLCLTYTCFVSANKLTTAANAIVLQFTSPIFILLLSALFLRRKIHGSDAIAAIVTLAGISMFFVDRLSAGGALGNVIGLLSGLFMGAMFVAMGEAGEDDRLSATFLAQVMTAAIGLPFAATSGIELTAPAVLSVVALGVLQLGIPYILLVQSMRSCPALACSLIGAVEPILNPVWVLIFDGERPSVMALLGGIVVIMTVTAWSIYSSRLEKQEDARSDGVSFTKSE